MYFDLPFKCDLCILNFPNQIDRNKHAKSHFAWKCCSFCNKTLIQIGDEWYEIRLHLEDDCMGKVCEESKNEQQEMLVTELEREPIPTSEKPFQANVILNVKSERFENIEHNQDSRSLLSESKYNAEEFVVDEVTNVCYSEIVQRYGDGGTCNSLVAEEDFLVQTGHEKHELQDYHEEQLLEPHIDQSQPFSLEQQCETQPAIKIKGIQSNGVKPFKCHICNKSLLNKNTLKNHINNLHKLNRESEKIPTCEVCGKSFANFGNLKAHMNIHSDTRPFICNFCGQGFNRYQNLSDHMNSHTGARPYKCKLCGKGFGRNTQINVHMRVHTGEKPYKCSIEGCDRAYAHEIDLKRHKYSAHGIYTKKHVCPICGKVYPENKLLKKHLNSHRDVQLYGVES